MLSSNCILDLRPGKMHMYTMKDPQSMEIKYVAEKAGEVGRLKMERAKSGHIQISCIQFTDNRKTPPIKNPKLTSKGQIRLFKHADGAPDSSSQSSS